MLLCEFNEIHRCHATYCKIKTIKTVNNEMFKEFVPPEFNKYNVIFLIPHKYNTRNFCKFNKVFELNKTILLPCFNNLQ
jgi:hypothetical protein